MKTKTMKLKKGKIYTIKYTGQFCHIASVFADKYNFQNKFTDGELVDAQFLGVIKTSNIEREIFHCNAYSNIFYIMMGGQSDINYIVDRKDEVKERIANLENELSELKKLI
jgi:hypothetical protein